jgi:hypothetical protein
MNAASQILRVLAIIGAIAAGAFFFLTRNKIGDLNSQLATANSSLTTIKTADAADLAAAKTRAESAEADKVKLTTDLQDAKKNFADESDLVNQASASATAALKESHAKDAALAEKQSEIDDLKKQTATIDSLQSDNDTLKGQLKDLQDQISRGGAPSSTSTSPGTTASTSPDGAPAPVALPTTPSGPVEPTTIGAVSASSGLVVIAADLQKDSAVMLEAGGTELGRGTILDSQAGQSVISITSTGEMSSTDFFKIVTQGRKVDYVLLK